MPNIKTFDANVRAPEATNVGAEAYEMEGRHVEADYAQAGQAIGRGLNSVGAAIQDHETMVGTADLLSGMANLDVQTSKDLDAAKTTMDPHDPNAMQDFLTAHEEALNNLEPGPMATDAVKRMYLQAKANYTTSTANRFLSYQTSAAADDVVTKFTGSGDAYANLALNDPTTYKSSLKTLGAAAMAMPAEHREAVLASTATKLADSAGEGVVQRLTSNSNTTPDQVDQAKQYLANPDNGLVQVMSPSQFAALNGRLDRIKDTQANVQSVINAQVLGNGYQQMQGNGGLDPNGQLKSIIDNYKGATPAETEVWKAEQTRKYNDAQAYGQASAGVASTPAPKVASNLDDLQAQLDYAKPDDIPVLQSKIAAITSASNARDKAFAADPAGYVAQTNELIGSRYAAFQSSPTPQNFAAYAQASMAEQQRLYPGTAPTILSHDLEGQIASTLNSATATTAGPAALAGAIQNYVKSTGALWPSVAIQLRQDKVISGNMGVGAELYGSPATQALGETIIQASALSPEDLKNKYGIPSEKAMAPVNKALAPIIATMANLPNADQVISDYRTAAVAAVQYTGDVNSATAVVNKMLTDRYNIEDKTLRIPKTVQGVDAGLVGSGASAVRADMGNHQLVLPPGFGAMGLTPDRYAAQIKSSGHWFTNADNTGALLYDVDGHNVQEMRNGKAVDVELSWQALQQAGNGTISGKLHRIIEGR